MAKQLPTQSRLHELFHYSPSTGVFRRKVRTSNSTYVGDIAGGLSASGYEQIRVDAVYYRAHRLAWMYIYGEDPGALDVDHINGDRADNSIWNLQLLPHKQNATRLHMMKGGTSQFRGVYMSAGKWKANVRANGHLHYFGRYDSELDAAWAAYHGAQRLHGDHCTYQPPEC